MLLQDFEPQFGYFNVEISEVNNPAPEHNGFIFYSFFMRIGTDKV